MNAEPEDIQMLFADIVDDAKKASETTDCKEWERRLNSILSLAKSLQGFIG